MQANITFFFQNENDPLCVLVTEEYLNHMSHNGIFADECVIRAMACCLQKDIYIVASSENPEYLWTAIEATRSTGSPFLLGHLGELHYVSLGKNFYISHFIYGTLIL